jgi:tetratricopeptide (TPR) repeat protein
MRISSSRPSSLLCTILFLGAASLSGSALAQGDEVTPEVQRLYAEAKAAEQQGHIQASIADYQKMLKLAPHLAPAYNNLGMLYFNQHDYDRAAKTLSKGLAINPEMPTASALLGMSYAQLGEDEKAETLLSAAITASPDDSNLQMAYAQTLVHLHKYDQATPYLRSYLERNPKDQQAWYLLGKTYLQLSTDSLAKIDQIDPNSVTAHEVNGEIDESMHNYEGAVVEYKKAVDLAPTQTGTHMHMGDAFLAMGKFDSAQTEFKAELENDHNSCMASWKLAHATIELNGSNTDALAELERSIDRCPQLMQARVDRARVLIKLNRQSEALQDLLLAETDTPKEPTIHVLLAQVYRADGKADQAQQEMHTYAQLQREASEAVAAQSNDAISIKSASH